MLWVSPRSRVMASNLLRPGDLWEVEGSPPSRCSTTSVVRFRLPHLLMPATYLPSHFRRNLKFLYGSRRVGLTGNDAIFLSPSLLGLQLTGHLLDLDHHEFRRIQWSKADEDIDDALINAGLGIVLTIALHKVGLLRGAALKRTLKEQPVHEYPHVQPDLAP